MCVDVVDLLVVSLLERVLPYFEEDFKVFDLILQECLSEFFEEHFIGLQTAINLLSCLYMLKQYLHQISNFFLLNIFDRVVPCIGDDGVDDG